MNIFVAVLLFFFALAELVALARAKEGSTALLATVFAGLAIWAGVWAVSV